MISSYHSRSTSPRWSRLTTQIFQKNNEYELQEDTVKDSSKDNPNVSVTTQSKESGQTSWVDVLFYFWAV